MRLGHKGFSLVEVVVSLAIMTIVGGAVSAFLIAGNNSYIRGNNDLNLQEEAQLTTNQMIDLIIDVQKDIRFSGETTGVAIKDDGSLDMGTSVPVKELTLINDDSQMILRWQGGSGDYANEVYLIEASKTWVDESGSEVSEGTEGATLKFGDLSADSATVTRSLLAQYVTAFDVDLSDLNSKRKVKLNLTFKFSGQEKEYKVSETIKLRNSFDGEDADEYLWIDGISIDSPVILERNVPQTISYSLTGDQGAIDAGINITLEACPGYSINDIQYKLVGSNQIQLSAGSGSSLGGSGGEDESTAAFKLIITSKADTAKTATAWVSVIENQIESIEIIPAYATMMQGDKLEFECVIKGADDVVAYGANWKVEETDGRTIDADTKFIGSSSGVSTVNLKVGDNQNTGMKVLKITAKSAAPGTNKEAYAYVSVNKSTPIAGLYDVKLVATNLTTYEIDASGTLGYSATIECLTSYADYKNGYPIIKWSETTLGDKAYTLVTSEAATDPYTNKPVPDYIAYLYCGTQINTHAYVQAEVQLDSENSMIVGIDITIPDLQRAVSSTGAYIDSDNFVLYRQGAVNLELKGTVVSDGETIDLTDSKYNDRITWEISNLSSYSDLADVGVSETWSKPTVKDEYEYKNYHYYRHYNAVGFGSTNVWNGAGEYWSYPKGQGNSTTINALYSIDMNNEYRLNVVAKLDGEKVAETNVLVPRFEFLFADGNRYMVVNETEYHNSPSTYLPIVAYGFSSTSTIGLSANYEVKLFGENALSSGTFLGGPAYYRNAADRFDLNFQLVQEKNDVLYLTFKDPDIGDSSQRVLIFYVKHNTTE